MGKIILKVIFFVKIRLPGINWVIRRHENLLNLKFGINFRFPVMYWNRKWFTLNICCVNNCQDSYCGFPIRVHFCWNFIVRLVVTVSRLCRGHLCWSMLLAMFWSHYDPILWSKYSVLALFDCSWTFPSDDNPYFDSFSNSLFVCRQL